MLFRRPQRTRLSPKGSLRAISAASFNVRRRKHFRRCCPRQPTNRCANALISVPEVRFDGRFGPTTIAARNFGLPAPDGQVIFLFILTNIAVLTQRSNVTLEYDAENMRITNLEEANQFVTRTYREGWTV